MDMPQPTTAGQDTQLIEELEKDLLAMVKRIEKLSSSSVENENLTPREVFIRKQDHKIRLLTPLAPILYNQIAKASEERNALCPPNKLPFDIWEIIFQFLIGNDISSAKRMRQLLGYSTVCRRWKSNLKEATNLWSIIKNPSEPRFISGALKRSGMASLTVSFKSWLTKSMLVVLKPHISRCKVLTVEEASREADSLFSCLTENSIPRLEVLRITDSNRKHYRPLIPTMSRLDGPNLRSVNISAVHIALNNFRIVGPLLRYLRLEIHPPSSHLFTHYSDFFTHVPLVEELELDAQESLLIAREWQQDQEVIPIVLPHLRIIKFTLLPGPTASALLRAIESPQCKTIEVKVKALEGKELDTGLLADSFSHQAAISQLLFAPTSIEIEVQQSKRKLHIDVRRDGASQQDQTRLHIEILNKHQPTKLALSMISHVNLSEVRILRFYAASVGELVSAQLPALGDLRQLHLRKEAKADLVLEALGVTSLIGSYECPKLEQLTLEEYSGWTQNILLHTLNSRYANNSLHPQYAPTPLTALRIDYLGVEGPLLDQAGLREIKQIVGKDRCRLENV
ncbi:hypothetical protein FRC02_005382 [Tulasnella sp. 418]|nr:hypothetical protein FRC02_005382 [Tulasnella sp. 418]